MKVIKKRSGRQPSEFGRARQALRRANHHLIATVVARCEITDPELREEVVISSKGGSWHHLSDARLNDLAVRVRGWYLKEQT